MLYERRNGDFVLQITGHPNYGLSLAKNASADIWSCCNAFITMMQTTELRDLDDLADTRHRP